MIGIFDSGFGGLTIMKEIIKLLPEYDYLYLGDNARVPYGNRSKETVTAFTEQAVRFLFEKGAELIIIACFTASALALRTLQEKLLRDEKSPYRNKKILGVIRPVVEKAVLETRDRRIGVAATRATIASYSFPVEIKKLNPSLTVIGQACPLLVPLIEEQWHTKPEARMILRKYLRPLKNKNVDTLILGCTHYPVMIKDFKRIMGKRTKVLDSGKIIAESLSNYLRKHAEIEKKLPKKGFAEFMTTDDPERFKNFIETFLGLRGKKVTQAAF